MKKSSLYFDTAATMPMTQLVVNKMLKHMLIEGDFGNPSSGTHVFGYEASQNLRLARTFVAKNFGCKDKDVIFTSGATESINLAISGLSLAHKNKGKHIITSVIEHKATLACCENLEKKGFDVSYLKPNKQGQVELSSIKKALREDTLLVSIMHINNETGVFQPIETIAKYLSNIGVMFHVDAAQSAGKFPIHMENMDIDFLSISAHKFSGPKGVGALLIRNRSRLKLEPLIYGGGQEFNVRSGTQAVHQVIGLKEALAHSIEKQAEHLSYIASLKQSFIDKLCQYLTIQIHGEQSICSPYIVNFSIQGISSDMLMNQLANKVAIASGSACSSGTVEPSYVLRSMGVEEDQLYEAVRVSFGEFHTPNDINQAVSYITTAVKRLRELMS